MFLWRDLGRGWRQLHVAETEKYAHVTYFLNGGRESPFEGEDRALIPSLRIATYDLQPEMSAGAITDAVVDAIVDDRYDIVIANFANPDMVGHTGDWDATVRAVETVDGCIGRIVRAMEPLASTGGLLDDHRRPRQRGSAARRGWQPGDRPLPQPCPASARRRRRRGSFHR